MIKPERCILSDKEYQEFLAIEKKIDYLLKFRLFFGRNLYIASNEISTCDITPKVQKMLINAYKRAGWKISIQHNIVDTELCYWVFSI